MGKGDEGVVEASASVATYLCSTMVTAMRVSRAEEGQMFGYIS